MTAPPSPDPDDSRLKHLSVFDESIRQGNTPVFSAGDDTDLRELEHIILQIQSALPREGKKLCGYPLIRSLGQGAIGPSFLVTDPKSNQPMVLRILWPELATKAKVRDAFRADAAAARNLLQPTLSRVKDFGDSGSICYVISSYTVGQSLAAWRLVNSGVIPWTTAVQFLARLAVALGEVHALGFSHGNLKPSNVILAGDKPISPESLGSCDFRITEFGLAKAVLAAGRSSQAGLPWPSPQFLPPEQPSPNPPTPAGDVYALGVILFELLTCRSPIPGATRDEVVKNAREVAPPSPRALGVDIPPALDDLIMDCLKKVPMQRPKNGQELASKLTATLPAPPDPIELKPTWSGWLRGLFRF